MGTSLRSRLFLLALVLGTALVAGCDRTLVRPGQSFRPTPRRGAAGAGGGAGGGGVGLDEAGEPIPGVHIVLQLGGRRGTAGTTQEGTFFDRGHVGEIGITATLEGYETAETTVTVVPDEIAQVEIVMVEE